MTGPDGVPVEGSRYAADRRRYRRGYYGRRRGPPRNAGEIGEMKDGVPEGTQLQAHRNPTYRPRFRRGPARPRPAPAIGEAEDKENQQAANGQTSRLPAVDSDVPTTIGAVPVPSTLFHKMAKRPRQVEHQMRTPLQLTNRAVPSDPGSQAP